MSVKNFLQIIGCNLAGFLLFFSWYLPTDHGFWFPIDKSIFYFFNQWLGMNDIFLYFVAFTNFRLFDSVSFIFMLLILHHYYSRQDAMGKRKIFCMGITMVVSAVLIKIVDGHIDDMNRLSASAYFESIQEPVNFVSKMTGLPAKDRSGASFPGDHGLMLLIFTSYLGRYFGKKAFFSSLFIFIVFSLPRVMSGAHWFTDIAVGSVSIVLVIMSWILLTPVSDKMIRWLEQKFPLSIFEKF